jgi:lipopolysaccharide exporter
MSNLKKGIFSSLLLVGESFLNKLIGLLSTLILARVLLPEDFGIVAIAALLVGFFEILSNTGAVQYLLRAKTISEAEVNTSWTINIMLRFSLGIIIYLFSFLAAEYYDDPRLIELMLALSLLFFIDALQNPGTIFLKRNQDYRKIVKVSIIGKILAVGTAVSVALYYQSYWALVAGQATNLIVALVGNYLIVSYSPKFELTNARKQWAFSGWMIPQSIIGFFRTQLDTLLVSSFFGKSELGSYHTMKYIAFIPTSHLIVPMTETVLVELRKASVDQNYFCKMFNASLLITMLIATPIAVFIFYFHEMITLLLLGGNWTKYSELLAIFSLLIPAAAVHRHCCRTLIVYSKPKHILIYEIFSFVFVYTILFYVGLSDLLIFTYARVGVEQVLSLFFLTYVSFKYTNIYSTVRLFVGLFFIISACAISIFLLSLLPIFSLALVVNLLMLTSMFFLLFISIFAGFYFLFLRKFEEWQYISSLLIRLSAPLMKKISF